jgi:hypothetical protein
MPLEADRPGEWVEVQADQSSLRRNRREVAARAGISETGKRANPGRSGETKCSACLNLRGAEDFQQLFEGSSFKHFHIDIEGALTSVTLRLDA